VKLTTSQLSCAECHEIWEPKPPGTLWATPGLLGYCFTFTFLILFLIRDDQQKDMLYYVILLESQLRNWKDNISCGCRTIKPVFMVNDDVFTTGWTQRKWCLGCH